MRMRINTITGLAFIAKSIQSKTRHLAFMRHTSVEPVVQPITLEVDVFWNPIIEGVFSEIVPVQFPR